MKTLRVVRNPNYNNSREVIIIQEEFSEGWVKVWTDSEKDQVRAKKAGIDLTKDDDVLRYYKNY